MMLPGAFPPLIALVATKPRFEYLLGRSLPSICSQARKPDALIVVSDERPLTEREQDQLRACVEGVPVHFLSNKGAHGAAGSWNTGIELVRASWPAAYIAILDDDDAWDAGHLQLCCDCAMANDMPSVIVSGLRLCKDGMEVPTTPPVALSADDFLAGNPGWQGSNTFISLQTLVRAGGFTEGLASCNDRDLAVRVLSLPGVSFGFTGKHTATWYLGTAVDQLSRKGGAEKLRGLAMFYQLHAQRMTPAIRKQFFERANAYFGFDESQITGTHTAG
ncbi:glycosyltransferase [Halopseudomonas pachastrellae]|nr:glycosyltransferase [Halopseudomonas pachastrellae]|tara:strand:- start:1472 stop:2299 length:828 start_codon:yes stop_codon:yes gene_type:complete